MRLYPTKCLLVGYGHPHHPARTCPDPPVPELESAAAEQGEAFLGTPGSLTERRNESGTTYWVHRFSDALNRRHETYLGKSDDPDVVRRVTAMRDKIEVTNATIARVRPLARAGFATVDRKAYYTLASLHNHGLFRPSGPVWKLWLHVCNRKEVESCESLTNFSIQR